jgi:hypothetical protein
METASIFGTSNSDLCHDVDGINTTRYYHLSVDLLIIALVIAGCISADGVNYSFYLVQFTYVSPNNYTIPPTSCPRTTCGIDGFTKIPQCTSLVIRVSYFGTFGFG